MTSREGKANTQKTVPQKKKKQKNKKKTQNTHTQKKGFHTSLSYFML